MTTKVIVAKKRPQIKNGLIPLTSIKRGKYAVIVANGPSHYMAGLERLNGVDKVDFFSINKPYEPIWPTPYWAFCDYSQWRRHKNLWRSYQGTIFNTESARHFHKNSIILKTGNSKNPTFATDPRMPITIGFCTSYVAMQIAYIMGYDRIYFSGLDMGPVDGKFYPWGSNPDVADAKRGPRFNREAKSFNLAATLLNEQERSKFYFCSEFNTFSYVSKFNRLNHDELVDHALS